MNKFNNYQAVMALAGVALVKIFILPSVRPAHCAGNDPQCEVLKERITKPRNDKEKDNRNYYCGQMKDRNCSDYKSLCENSHDTGSSVTSPCGVGREWDDVESGHRMT